MRKIDLENRKMWDVFNNAWVMMPDDGVGFSVTDNDAVCAMSMPASGLDKNAELEDIKSFLRERTGEREWIEKWVNALDKDTTEVVLFLYIDGARWNRILKTAIKPIMETVSVRRKVFDIVIPKSSDWVPRDVVTPGQYNAQDFLAISYPPGCTHLRVVYPDGTTGEPLPTRNYEKGGNYLVLKPEVAERLKSVGHTSIIPEAK